MTDAASLKRAVEGVDTVVHLVAIRQGSTQQFERIMSQGTRDLLAASKDAGVGRFILMSALGTSEESKDLVPYYGAKWEMEQAVEGAGIPYVIFRPSFVFERDGGILPTFAKLARFAPVTPITGSGRQRIQPIWAGDLAAYFDKAIDLDAATNRTFELGGPDVVSWNEFWERLKKVRGITAAERPRPDGPDEDERARHRAAPRQHPAHARPPEDARARRQRGHERRRGADVPAPARAARRAVAQGRLMADPQIVAAGGLGDDGAAGQLIRFVLELSGKERPRVCLVPTASSELPDFMVRFYSELSPYAECSHVSFFPWPREDVRDHVLSRDVIFVSGGNTANMLAVWRVHGFDEILREAWEAGIVLAGSSAGMICWFEAGVTDSFGPQLEGMRDGLGFLAGSACPHYDGEERRRPVYQELVAGGFPAGLAADDGVGLHFVGTELKEAVSVREGANAYRVESWTAKPRSRRVNSEKE